MRRQEFAALLANAHRTMCASLAACAVNCIERPCEVRPAPFSKHISSPACPYTENPRAFHLNRALIHKGYSDAADYTKTN
jgi:hypothetical protein